MYQTAIPIFDGSSHRDEGNSVAGLVDLLVLGGVAVLQLLDANHSGTSVLGATNLLLDEGGLGGSTLFGGLLLNELVDGLLVIGLARPEPDNAGLQLVVSGLALVLILRHFVGCRSKKPIIIGNQDLRYNFTKQFHVLTKRLGRINGIILKKL